MSQIIRKAAGVETSDKFEGGNMARRRYGWNT
jgi:hypothetical protein